jgi:alpha-N-arabinofuranosidase
VAGVTLNIFNAHAERIHMANIAQAVNVLQSPVLTEGSRVVLTPTWHVFAMYAAHQDARLLKTTLATSEYHHKDASLPRITASASCSDAGVYTITLCNLDPHQSETSEIIFDSAFAPLSRVSAEVLSAETMNAMNTFEAPEQVTRKTLPVEITGANTLRLVAPAKSLIAVTVA